MAFSILILENTEVGIGLRNCMYYRGETYFGHNGCIAIVTYLIVNLDVDHGTLSL